MIEIQIEKLQRFKAENIELPADMVGGFNPEFDTKRNEYIMDNHKGFYDKVIDLWRILGGMTMHKGHTQQLDVYKNSLGQLIYI
jgi:hypothetical protein